MAESKKHVFWRVKNDERLMDLQQTYESLYNDNSNVSFFYAYHHTKHNCYKLHGFHVCFGFKILWKKCILMSTGVPRKITFSRENCACLFCLYIMLVKDSHHYVCASAMTENLQMSVVKCALLSSLQL